MLGLFNYYRKFVKDYSKLTVPLNKLLQKEVKFCWTDECQKAFDILKQAMTTTPILAYPDMSRDFILTCDASGHAIGYILGHKDDENHEQVISYGGTALKNEEKIGQYQKKNV